jgi:hypothetical protein
MYLQDRPSREYAQMLVLPCFYKWRAGGANVIGTDTLSFGARAERFY